MWAREQHGHREQRGAERIYIGVCLFLVWKAGENHLKIVNYRTHGFLGVEMGFKDCLVHFFISHIRK